MLKHNKIENKSAKWVALIAVFALVAFAIIAISVNNAKLANADEGDNGVKTVDVNDYLHTYYPELADSGKPVTITVNESNSITDVKAGWTDISSIPSSRTVKNNCTGYVNSCWFAGVAPYADMGFYDNGTTNGNWPGRSSYRTYDRWSSIYFNQPNGTQGKVENIDHNYQVDFNFNPVGTAVVLW